MLIAPNWGMKKAVMQQQIDRVFIERGIKQGSLL
jgi:radical SAM superfamily enzyme